MICGEGLDEKMTITLIAFELGVAPLAVLTIGAKGSQLTEPTVRGMNFF